MAILGKIRSKGGLLVGIIGLGLFAFISEEAFRSCESSRNERRQQIGQVLGEKIDVQQFQKLVDEYTDVIKMTQGRDNLSEAELNSVKDQVWNNFVQNKIIEKEAEKIGLTVTDQEIANILAQGTNPMLAQTPFINQQTGRFDVNMLKKFLDEYKKISSNPQSSQVMEQYTSIYNYWTFIEKTLRQSTLANKYQSLLASCLLSNPVSAKRAFDDRSTESSIQLASLAYSTVNDNDVKISDADLKAKYDQMKEMFKQNAETRDIKYVDFKVEASKADRDAIDKDMKEAQTKLQNGEDPATTVRKANSLVQFVSMPVSARVYPSDIAKDLDSMAVGQVKGPKVNTADNTINVIKLIAKVQKPDSVQFRQILIGAETPEKAQKTADSVSQALRGGAEFAVLAKKYGQEGKEQWLTSAMYESLTQSPEGDNLTYLKSIIDGNVNEVQQVALSGNYAIIQVLAKRAPVTKYQAAVVKRSIDFSKDTYSAAYNKFSQFVSESNGDAKALEANAKKYGYKVLERADIVNSEHNVVGLRATRDAMKWIFEAKENNVSPLYECGNNDHLLVMIMTKIHPEGYRSLEDVKDIVKAEVMKDKKFDVLAEKLKGVTSIEAAKAKGAQITEVNQITASSPAFVQATGAGEPALSGAVAAVAQGKFSPKPVKGNAGAYLFQVTNKAKSDGKFDEKSEENSLKQRAFQAASRFMSELYSKAGVVDNRYLFF